MPWLEDFARLIAAGLFHERDLARATQGSFGPATEACASLRQEPHRIDDPAQHDDDEYDRADRPDSTQPEALPREAPPHVPILIQSAPSRCVRGNRSWGRTLPGALVAGRPMLDTLACALVAAWYVLVLMAM